jgi:hypothetical protein
MGIEPTTSSLPRKCSTPELRRLFSLYFILKKSGRRGSNPRPTAWKAVALPTELRPLMTCFWCGSRWIRTTEEVHQQIYSLSHLAALECSHFLFFLAVALKRSCKSSRLILNVKYLCKKIFNFQCKRFNINSLNLKNIFKKNKHLRFLTFCVCIDNNRAAFYKPRHRLFSCRYHSPMPQLARVIYLQLFFLD